MYVNNVNTTSTDYVGSTAYTDGAFNYLTMGEGRVIKTTGTTGNFVYEYHVKDHLGNTRLAFEAVSATSLAVKQRADYYPFGLQFKNNPQYLNNDNKYLYNGKEMQDDMVGGVALGWLDYGKRMYDPQLGRFTCTDPLADKFVWVSPYNYAENSPIANLDLWGLQAWPFQRNWNQSDISGFAAFTQSQTQYYTGQNLKMDCRTYAIRLLVDYASQN